MTTGTPEGYVLDTDVLSFLFRGDSRGQLFRPFLSSGALLAISFMTVAELDQWALLRGWGADRVARMTTFLEQFTIVMVDRQLCRIWAEVGVQARRNGRPIQSADAWIAAAALRLDVPLLTHNPADYAGVENLIVLPGLGS